MSNYQNQVEVDTELEDARFNGNYYSGHEDGQRIGYREGYKDGLRDGQASVARLIAKQSDVAVQRGKQLDALRVLAKLEEDSAEESTADLASDVLDIIDGQPEVRQPEADELLNENV